MTQNKASLEEQALSKATEIGISSQLDEVEAINVDVHTDPLKIIQGQVDSVSIQGEGMVMQGDLRMEKMQLQTGAISINPLSIAFGKVELTRPTEATAHVVLTESDINRAFNSDYIREKLQNLDVQINGRAQKVDTQRIEFQLPGDGKFALSADVQLKETGEAEQVAFTAVPRVSAGGQCVVLEKVEYAAGENHLPELTEALLSKASEVLDLRNFELEGMSLRLKRLDAQTGKLMLEGEAQIEEFPG